MTANKSIRRIGHASSPKQLAVGGVVELVGDITAGVGEQDGAAEVVAVVVSGGAIAVDMRDQSEAGSIDVVALDGAI